MWSLISNQIASLRPKGNHVDESQACLDQSDDEICPNANTDEGLECPICCESFNIVENVPYVLWCGHTLCKNCVLGIKCASLKISNQQIQIPFLISCPWCHSLTPRLVHQDNLTFPRKNFFLLWMVESLNGDSVNTPSSICGAHQPIWSPRCTSVIGNRQNNTNLRRVSNTHRLGRLGSNSNFLNVERPHLTFHKSLDYFIHLTAKFSLVIILLLIIICVIPASVAILALYLLVTVLFALPSFLVLYFAYPCLDRLIREITS